MGTLIGLLVVVACVLGGFGLSGGPFLVLVQPFEVLIIGGAAAGAVMISAPGRAMKRFLKATKHGFSGHAPDEKDYLELLKVLSDVFQVIRREGMLAMEAHVGDPSKSSIFSKYPGFLKRKAAVTFLSDTVRQMVDGCSVESLAMLCDTDLETQQAEEHEAVGLMRSVGDALPGLGIVAAVLGIVITMGHLDAGPEEIGHHVACALVGTFLGILLSYGFIGPLAARIEMQGQADNRYMTCIKDGLLAAARGDNPTLSLEFARRAIFPDERPTGAELYKATTGRG